MKSCGLFAAMMMVGAACSASGDEGVRTIDSFATCPDNSVIYQHGTISERYAGGVATPVRLGNGGKSDMACPLRPL